VDDVAPAFGVLGELEVIRGGVPVPVPGPRRRAILAALLVRAGRAVSADALAEAAWGDDLPTDPRAALHTALSRLRATLGDGALRAGPAGYLLDPGQGGLDARRFEDLRDRAARLRAADSPAAAALLDEALALWRGPAYEEFADRNFARQEAARLEELRLVTVEDRAGLALELGKAETAVTATEALVAEHPLRERAHGLLMTALYHAGQPTEALDRYRQYRTFLVAELGVEPSPALRELHQRMLRHELPDPAGQAPVRRRHKAGTRHPPAWTVASTAFFGRERETRELSAAVAAHNLVTVTGTGGVGKTRLVAEALSDLGCQLGLPPTVVELASVTAGNTAEAIAAALGLQATMPAGAAIVEYLSIAEGLLILDSCEHVRDEVRALVREILVDSPGIRVIATSRHRLGLATEQVLPLGPLQLPSPGASAAQGHADLPGTPDAVLLFADRMRRIRPSATLTPDAVAIIADICRQLDGLPLALELAATRAAALGLGPLRDRLGDSLDLLGGDGDPRHEPLRAVVAWSYGLLSPRARRLLAVLSVFHGDFDLDAAEQVAGHLAELLTEPPGEPSGGDSAASAFAQLVDSSLVAYHEDMPGPRYRLLMIVRAFADEKLAETGLADAARHAHARWAAAAAESAGRQTAGPGCADALTWLAKHRADLAAAVRWALDANQAEPASSGELAYLAGRITGAIGKGQCGHWRPAAALVQLTAEAAADPGVRASPAAALALGAGAMAACESGDFALANDLGNKALQLAADPAERYLALVPLGVAALRQGDLSASTQYWERLAADEDAPAGYRAAGFSSLALTACYSGDPQAAQRRAAQARLAAAASGSGAFRAFASYAAGETALLESQEAAIALLRAAADEAAATGADQVITVALIALVSALTQLQRHDEALAVFPSLLQQARRNGDWPYLWTALRIGAELLAASGQPETAALLLAAARHAPSAPTLTGADVVRYRDLERDLERQLRQQSGPGALGQIDALARTLPRAQVVDHALGALAARGQEAILESLSSPGPPVWAGRDQEGAKKAHCTR
jgi:predicted ATPase/DNA-binding SARP family transcriptional activator